MKAQVVGVPDEMTGEAVVVVVHLTRQAEISFEGLRTSITRALGSLHTPSMILNLTADLDREQFPATVSGKPQKAILRRWV